MSRFVGVFLSLSVVTGEAIPESLTMGPLQDFLYGEAVRLHKPYCLGEAHLQEETSTSENISPSSFSGELKQPATDLGSQQELIEPKPLNVPAPKVTKNTPIAEYVSKPSKPISSAPIFVEPKKSKVNPKQTVSQKALTPEVKNAQERAKDLYGKEPGYVGVTDNIVKDANGRRFLYVNIKGDGNCGFYAAGIDRSKFVDTIKDLVNEQHAAYQAFVNERTLIACSIASIKIDDDKKAIIERFHLILDKANNGDSLKNSLLMLSDYENKKIRYRVELFQDARNDLIQKLQSLKSDVKVCSNPFLLAQINDLIASVASANYEDKNIQTLAVSGPKIIIEELHKIKVSNAHIIKALKMIQGVLSYSDEELFEKFKSRLINQVQNLTAQASYEAFLIALGAELGSYDLVYKEKLLADVKKTFSFNRGAATWFPGGLFGALKDRLNVKYNIWRSSNDGRIQLYSSTGDARGVSEKGLDVRNMFFTGGHYDLLFPMDDC